MFERIWQWLGGLLRTATPAWLRPILVTVAVIVLDAMTGNPPPDDPDTLPVGADPPPFVETAPLVPADAE